jgi:co-chaperonin GroES (HSP10)
MFKPVNRHIIIDPPQENSSETTSGILLPDDYSPTQEKYATVTVLAWATDVRFSLYEGREIIVDQNMIDEVTINNEKFNMILDNYVIGII